MHHCCDSVRLVDTASALAERGCLCGRLQATRIDPAFEVNFRSGEMVQRDEVRLARMTCAPRVIEVVQEDSWLWL